MPNESWPELGGQPGRWGTPGASPVAADGTALMILKVRHQPLIPGPNDPVLVTAHIDESAGNVTVRLRYRVDQSVYTTRTIT
jgi:hypothetical protein